MKRLVVLALTLMAAAGLSLACVPTPMGSAALANPAGPVTGPLNATGCMIGVYIGSGVGVIANAEIFGATYYGVVNDGAIVNITASSIHNIGEVPFNGAQHGVGILFLNGATGLIDGNTVSAYQKGGIVVKGVGTSAAVTNNVVAGLGPVAFIAQNGVQVSIGATGTVSGNQISGNAYTGCSHQDAAKTGCTPWVSAGLLLYDIDANQVKKSNNQFRNNQFNMLVLTSASLHSGI